LLKKLKRYPYQWKKLKLSKNNKLFLVNEKKFCKPYASNGIIKLHKQDFRLINKAALKYTHFNIKDTGHKVGHKFYIMKILKPGYFDGKKNYAPVLDMNFFFVAKCTYVKNNVSYTKLKKSIFKNSLKNIQNKKQLIRAIKRRYKKSLSHITDESKVEMGVAITKLVILKKVKNFSLSNNLK